MVWSCGKEGVSGGGNRSFGGKRKSGRPRQIGYMHQDLAILGVDEKGSKEMAEDHRKSNPLLK